jgi:putative ABC transport system permease protein
MNLAFRDIAHQWQRFVATGIGLGLLFTIVLAMGGIYRGMVEDATVLVDAMAADLWIVQRGTRGPFAERSVLPSSLSARARVVPGVESARAFTTITIQPVHEGRVLRISLVGLDWPDDRGQGLSLEAGRPLRAAHEEIVVDRTLGVALGETLRLGDGSYRVVGIGKGMVSSGGDALGFVTQRDIDAIQRHLSPEALRVARATGAPPSAGGISAVLVRVRPGASAEAVRAHIGRWEDVSVHDAAEQRGFLLLGVVDKARRQIGLFRGLLAVVSGIVVSLVIFNMTVAKTREIALLKLMGARLSLVAKMILQQSLLLSLLAFGVALALSRVAFPMFPRRVVVGPEELVTTLALSVAIALLASVAAIRRALGIPATTILAG